MGKLGDFITLEFIVTVTLYIEIKMFKRERENSNKIRNKEK